MKRIWALMSAALVLTGAALRAEPAAIIFDTDIGNDVDDVLALGMIHNLEARGACKLLAVTLTIDHPKAAAFTDAVNTFYGRGEIPIGAVRNGKKTGEGRFLRMAHAQDNGVPRYPHDLKSGDDAPEAVSLLRQILGKQPDGSVTLIQVGFSTNFARLLDSPPDAHSPLNGRDLVKQKVRLLSLMAGAFTKIGNDARYKEYNITNDIPAAQKVAAQWPTPTVWSGFEIGIAATFPAKVVVNDFNYVAHHPLKEAYYLYEAPPHERPTWDLTSVLYALYPDRGYFDLSESGSVTVENDGFTTFVAQENGLHRYLKMNATQAARVREALAQMCVQPPPKR
jgi:inosine-uridine nucleoside N-ribohydrolase